MAGGLNVLIGFWNEKTATPPVLTFSKTADKSFVTTVGEVITYTYTIENVGSGPATNVQVTDDNTDAPPVYQSGDVNANDELDPGEIWIYTAQHTVVQAEIDLPGTFITNIATVDTDQTDALQDSVAVEVDPPPTPPVIAFAKTADKSVVSTPGEVITYTYTVTNSGNSPATNPNVTDNNTDSPPVYQSGDLNTNGQIDPGETWVYTAQHTYTP